MWELPGVQVDEPHYEIVGEDNRSKDKKEVTIAEQQFEFMPGRSTTDAIFCLRMLLESGLKGRRQCTVPLLTWRKHTTGYPERNCGNACS